MAKENQNQNHDYESGLSALGKALGRNDLDMVQAVRVEELEAGLERGIIPQGGLAHRRISQLYSNIANRIRNDRESVAPQSRCIDSPDDILDAAFFLSEPEEESKPSLLPPQLPKLKGESSQSNGKGNFLASSPL